MDINRTKELLEKFSQQRILVLGDVVLDHYVHGDVDRLNPEAPVPILRVRREHEETGGAGNVAKYASQLGASATLISVTGDDADGQILAETARRDGYETRLIRDSSRPTIRKTRHIVENKTAGQQLLRVDFEETHSLDPEIEEQLAVVIKEEIDKGVGGIVVSDYAKGVITKNIADIVLDEAGQRDVLVAADVKPSRSKYFVGASLVSPNIKEAHEFVGLNHHEQEVVDYKELARLVYMKMCADVYLTMGAKGMYVYCGGECGSHLSETVQAIEPSCAGDSAITVILLALLAGANEAEAAAIAGAACGVIVRKVGSGGLSVDEVMSCHEEMYKSREWTKRTK